MVTRSNIERLLASPGRTTSRVEALASSSLTGWELMVGQVNLLLRLEHAVERSLRRAAESAESGCVHDLAELLFGGLVAQRRASSRQRVRHADKQRPTREEASERVEVGLDRLAGW